MEDERIVKNIQHEILWCLRSAESTSTGRKPIIQIVEGLNADRIDMSIVRDEFTPAAFSFSGWLGGWLAGFQPKGTQEIEEMD